MKNVESDSSEGNSRARVGFIGVGNMGHPMAKNLLKAGFVLKIHDVNAERGAPLLRDGAEWASSVGDCASDVDFVLTSLPGPLEIEHVVVGPKGLLASMRKGAIWIDLSTNDPTLLRQLAAQLGERGVSVLDAPVTGGVEGAEAGNLTVMCGGERDVYEAAQDVLEAIAGRLFHMGPVGTGAIAKLVVQQLYYIHIVGAFEALTLAAAFGCNKDVVCELIKSSVAASYATEFDVTSTLNGRYDPSFNMRLAVKDLRLIDHMVDSLSAQGIPGLPLTSATSDVYIRALKTLGDDASWLRVAEIMASPDGMGADRPRPV